MAQAKLSKTLVLVGMMGAGKTAVGMALAARLKVDFVDSDHEIEKAANMSVAEIFSRDGEAFFREKESLVLARLLEGPPCVLSTGGGAFLQAGNRAMIAKDGISLWLKADIELLWSRVKHKDTRPLLRGADPKAMLTQLYAARAPFYAQSSLQVTAKASYSIEDMATKVVEVLMASPGILPTGKI